MSFAPRHLFTRPPLTLADRWVKRYEISIESSGVPAVVADNAYRLLPTLLPAVGDHPTASFSVLHRGEAGSYLLAYTWTLGDVLVLHKAVAGIPALGAPDDDPAHFGLSTEAWIGCVWELGPLEHERSAWVEHVLRPERPDIAAYVDDVLSVASVGEPTGR